MGDDHKGFWVDPVALEECRQRLAQVRYRTAELLRVAEQADPEWFIWGALGAQMAAAYWGGCGRDLYRQLEMMAEGIAGRVEAIDAAGKAYQDTDRGIAEALRGIHRLLGEDGK
ncbi:hypothetical protein Lfu02_48050 [Longispora fulva]|uniref:Excreted virulence factor EspC (Type VII ESX diderm) n=1 Tax=Longispora fulva TaxID=619741 RepID=A0A8J7GVF1_9ACTN|nr:hypothetical protein [Longispora fulva]MBG6138181.1 hypothetical protein [Longispora fulva]GIG60433.1 hypothetical protein Lfu02_48050 [Longispora fulva]